MRGPNPGRLGERRNRPCDSGNPGASAAGERQPLDGARKELGRLLGPPWQRSAQAIVRSRDSLADGSEERVSETDGEKERVSKSEILVGWICYLIAITQYLIIGLVTSRDRAIDVLSEFDRQVAKRRQEIVEEFRLDEDGNPQPQNDPPPAEMEPPGGKQDAEGGREAP